MSMGMTSTNSKMAMKKPTKSDIKAGRVYRCGNCDAFCSGEIELGTNTYVMGRPKLVSSKHYCDDACACKSNRDEMRPIYEKNIEKLKRSETVLKRLLARYILEGKKSKTLFQAIKMVRQWSKALTMLLGGEYALHIMKVEFFKLSEAAMELAELVADEEDLLFNACVKVYAGTGPLTETKAQNLAMHARCMAEDKNHSLSMWFN
jgi:hypothetical protein